MYLKMLLGVTAEIRVVLYVQYILIILISYLGHTFSSRLDHTHSCKDL